MYLVFLRMPGESYCRRLRSLLVCLYVPCGKHLFPAVVVIDIDVIDRFYIALFSALEQTHCARM